MRTFADKFNIQDRQIVDNVVEVLISILTRIHEHNFMFSVGERVHIHKLTKKLVELKNKLHGITISQEAIPPEITETIDHVEEPKAVESVQIEDRPADALVLHCERCSVDGARMHDQSEIAVIDTEKLRLPLEADMFSSINPKREIPSFWKPGNTWATVRCMWGNHTPFNLVDDAMTQQRQKDGGPRRLLTNRGWIEIDETGIVDKQEKLPEGQISVENLDENYPDMTGKGKWICEFCGKEFKTKANLGAHKRSHKEK